MTARNSASASRRLTTSRRSSPAPRKAGNGRAAGREKKSRTCSLDQALSYKNPDIVARFAKEFRISKREANSIFRETKKWLWLNSLPDRPRLVVTTELLILDEMWHTFILFTSEYTEYCVSNLGGYMHHAPTTERQKKELQRKRRADPDAVEQQDREEMARQYQFIAEHLGKQTLIRWYAEYPLAYGREFFAQFGKDVPELDEEVEARMLSLLPARRRDAILAARG